MRKPTELQVDAQKLWQLAQEGKSAQEMMETLDIRDMAALKEALVALFREKGETVNVPGLIGQASIDAEYTDRGNRIDPSMKD